MNWNLEGLTVFGRYLGSMPVKGKVTLSRVKYGGGVSHHVELETPLLVYGNLRNRIILEHEFVERVVS